MSDLTFIASRRQNSFFTELMETIRWELEQLGLRSEVTTEPLSGRSDPNDTFVLIAPHEYVALEGWSSITSKQLSRTIVVCTEQPGTKWFTLAARVAAHAHATFDINPAALEALQADGVDARLLQLGYSPFFDRRTGEEERDVDLVFLGSLTPRREAHLAAAAEELARHRCHLLFSDDKGPRSTRSQTWSTGADKWSLLARSRVLLNLHRSDTPYFEWLRVVEAASNGCAVVSETSQAHHPLLDGEHLLLVPPEKVVSTAAALIGDEGKRARLAAHAEGVLRQIPMSAAAAALANVAAELRTTRPRRRATPVFVDAARDRVDGLGGRLLNLARIEAAGVVELARQSRGPERAALKALRVDLIGLRRNVAELTFALEHGEIASPVALETPAYASSRPDVTVLISSYNHGGHLRGCLDSVAAAHGVIDLVLVDDGSDDDTRDVVETWLSENPNFPALYVRFPTNRGLPSGRNAALGRARGEFVFILDADNEVLPGGVVTLQRALDRSPASAFAYGYLQLVGPSGPIGLSNTEGWDVPHLAAENYIDAMALIRTSALRAVGGYSTDARLHGWEDYDLWCSFGERGWSGTMAPQVVGKYRVAGHSMLRSVTNLSTAEAESLLDTRHPRVRRSAVQVRPPFVWRLLQQLGGAAEHR